MVNIFANCCFYQIGACQVNGSFSGNHQGFIAHYRQVGTTGYTGAHYGGNLGNAHGAHSRIVPENPAKMFLIRKNFILHGQKNAGTIYKVNNGQMVFHGNFLQPQVFFAGYGEPGTCLYRLIVGQYYTLPAADITYTTYRTTGRATAFGVVHVVSRKGTNFHKGFVLVQQVVQPFAWSKFLLFVLLFNGFFASTKVYFIKCSFAVAKQKAHGIIVAVKL